ncbi:OLC1v1029969C1 [Oldenlandia corymbosa var. corymbosa]|uniref:OLC1v1029969C1 n=1 Tax=Oldenlandia corymbosa var. corymbosa TaxID=529605 RepID=A0AAV1CGI7_OLDCO|nr:OLC1v1029969C1 [Oldenlandia corymbosa var. corymbosa]
MDQFRQIGEVLGSLKALMVLKHDILINQRQCCLLFDIYVSAFETISDEIRQNFRLDERNIKWKPLELPLKELHRVFKEGELYIRYCLDVKDWWGKAISLHMNRDCVEFHIHNLLSCFPVVIEAIETVAEFSVSELEDMQKRRSALMRKYDSDWDNPKFFEWMYGKQYLVPRDTCTRLDSDSAWKEDRWLLLDAIREKKAAVPTTLAKHEHKLGDLLMNKLNSCLQKEQNKKPRLLPSSVLVGSYDYHVKRRLGLGEGHVKEIQWLGESFALRTFFGDIEPLNEEIALVQSLSHPNILQHLCGFYDEERKEGFLLMELMNKDLKTCIRENSGQRKRLPFSVPVAVDIMLQIARGLEYLHSKSIYHGELNPSNILLKPRNCSAESYFHVKLTGFGLISIKTYSRSPHSDADPVIWYAPEVLAAQEQVGKKGNIKYSEKADVYSFGMLCFELLTGKVPFEDSHLQGDKMVRNIRAGGRPLFPYPAPKYLANLTRKCWHPNPDLRPKFSAICRILRYIKMILIINPDHGQPESPPPLVEYIDIEASYTKKFTGEGVNADYVAPVSQIPFQLYAYRIIQKEKTSANDENWEMGNEELPRRPASISGEENLATIDDMFLVPSDRRSVCSEIIESRNLRAFDQRTVISEIPQKLFLSDQRSTGSESPSLKSLHISTADQSSIRSRTPERNLSQARSVDQSSIRSRTPERKLSTSTSQKMKHAENPEKQTLSIADQKATDSKSQTGLSDVREQNTGNNIPEEEAKSTITAVVNVPNNPSNRVLNKKLSSKKIAHRRKLSEIPEKAVSASLAKKPSANKKSTLPRNSEKKTLPKRKPKEIVIPKGPGLSNDDVPKSSSSRISRSSSTNAASPTGWPLRLASSQASKGYMSSPQSPLHSCARCSRTGREMTALSSASMSPRRAKFTPV